MASRLIFVCALTIFGPFNCIRANFQCGNNGKDCEENEATCKGLFLTPYIEAGKIQKAQRLARVHLPDEEASNIISYSGYLTVNKECNSNLFFWFIQSENNYEEAPVTLWLQGGPGCSSLFGMFQEIGPFYFDDNQNKLVRRNYTWNSISSLLFIDNPVGTGFSFTDHEICYATNEDDVRKDLYNGLVQFFQLFPELQKNDFYVFGESYAGKYIPAIAYSIDENNPKSEVKINLKGLGIGNGLSDPINMLLYSDYVYQLGLVDEIGKNVIQTEEEITREMIKRQKWAEAAFAFSSIIGTINKTSGDLSVYNYAKMRRSPLADPLQKYLNRYLTKCAIHARDIMFLRCNDNVNGKLTDDLTKSVKPWIEELLEKYRILFYNGQYDIIVPYPLTRNFVNKLNWSGADGFKKQLRKPFYARSETDVCGYIKGNKNLYLALVRKSGHMVPEDQPECAYYLYRNFLYGI